MAIYSGFSHKKIVIFHSYVKLPEGKPNGFADHYPVFKWLIFGNIHEYTLFSDKPNWKRSKYETRS